MRRCRCCRCQQRCVSRIVSWVVRPADQTLVSPAFKDVHVYTRMRGRGTAVCAPGHAHVYPRTPVCRCISGMEIESILGEIKIGILIGPESYACGKCSHGFQGTLILNFHRLTAAQLQRAAAECHQTSSCISFMLLHEIQISLEKIDAGIRPDTDTGSALPAFRNG